MVHQPEPLKHFVSIPKDLKAKFDQVEREFTISAEKLQEVTSHFNKELEEGLSKEDGNIPLIPGWVLDFPTGQETGDYLAIDLGGTNLRIVAVNLKGNSDFSFTHSKYALPDWMRTAKAEQLWDFIADCLEVFVKEFFPDGVTTCDSLPLGFTFSYPAFQNAINSGILQTWTKGFDIHGVEGHDLLQCTLIQIPRWD
ncbi:unnamed protein product [Ambrosiozyma monospora]|uniref:Unnamed protein product n=1 Tax=Ambrosiozyma monospora TaxID=43982 RepID=A0ACB5T8P3_AMBMO|nr:unnamed protein product [Ambrosiozyma monospora]